MSRSKPAFRLVPQQFVIHVALAVVVIVIIASLAFQGLISRYARTRVIQSIQESFGGQLQVKNLSVTVFPTVRVNGEEFVLRFHGRTDLPPLIQIGKLSAESSLLALLTGHVRQVNLDGLVIQVPPKSQQDAASKPSRSSKIGGVVIDEIRANGTILRMLPKDSKKEPLVWDIQRLTLGGAGASRQMTFRATLVNAKPPGDIESTGNFGPWRPDQPSETPVEGSYTFRNADLSVFRGIAGKLSSTGTYHGVLEQIEVQVPPKHPISY